MPIDMTPPPVVPPDAVETMPPNGVVTPWYEDKGVRMVAVFLLTLVANAIGKKWGVSLNVEEIATLGLTILGFILGNRWSNVQKFKAVESAKSSADVAAAVNARQ